MDHDPKDILAGLPMAAILVGADARVAQANAAALALLGRGVVGRHHGFALRQPEVLAAITAALAGAAQTVVRQVLPGSSHDVVHRITVSPVGTGALCLFQDVSELEQSEQMRRDFVANVSHELRTPLTALLGFIETLRGPARDDAAARARFLTIMAAEAERMNRLVSDLLHLSRVEAQERQRPATRHDLAAIIGQAVQNLRPLAEATGVAVSTQGLDHPVPVLIDPDQMMQVATNLIENAINYGRAGKRIAVALALETGPRGPQARLDVTDFGQGFDPKHIPRLAERFYRIDGHRSREQGGTGLGLAIVKHIAHRHRGRLVIASAMGKGATFSVILPAD